MLSAWVLQSVFFLVFLYKGMAKTATVRGFKKKKKRFKIASDTIVILTVMNKSIPGKLSVLISIFLLTAVVHAEPKTTC